MVLGLDPPPSLVHRDTGAANLLAVRHRPLLAVDLWLEGHPHPVPDLVLLTNCWLYPHWLYRVYWVSCFSELCPSSLCLHCCCHPLQAVTHHNNPAVLAEVSAGLGEAMVGIDIREKGFNSYAQRSE
jgi:hypothetical protein